VHGCFWHRHLGCKLSATPQTRQEFWLKKFELNVERDRAACQSLLRSGWRVAVIWECATRSRLNAVVDHVSAWLISDEKTFSSD
jgi:DNA mismatch endonuclease (patch repair protein)